MADAGGAERWSSPLIWRPESLTQCYAFISAAPAAKLLEGRIHKTVCAYLREPARVSLADFFGEAPSRTPHKSVYCREKDTGRRNTPVDAAFVPAYPWLVVVACLSSHMLQVRDIRTGATVGIQCKTLTAEEEEDYDVSDGE